MLKETQKVQLEINDQTHTVVVNSVNIENKKVEIGFNEIDETFVIGFNETKKIDLDDDGYYDLQISVKEVRSNSYANLEFKEIHEEVPAEEQEAQEEESKIKIQWWVWVVGGAILLIVVGIVMLKVLVKKKRRSKFNK